MNQFKGNDFKIYTRFENNEDALTRPCEGSTGVHHSRARPYFSRMSGSSNLDSFRDGW